MQLQTQDSFTRGSQLFAHKVRMFWQGAKNSFLVGLIISCSWLAMQIITKLQFSTIYYLIIERYVQIKLLIGQYFYPSHHIGISFYNLQSKSFIYRSADDFLKRFWQHNIYGKEAKEFLTWVTERAFWEITIIFAIGIVLTIGFFIYRGKAAVGTIKLRGGDILSPKKLARLLRKKKSASKFIISGLPLVAGSESQHLLLTGTTGCGKTNMLNELLPQIRAQNHRAIILDLTGSFVDRFFIAGHDKILNPFAPNTENWLPWNDCQYDFEFDALASAFIDGEGFSDKYWEEAAQKVLSEALQKHQTSKSLKSLLNLIATCSLAEFCKYFEESFAAGLVSKESEKTTASVRATLINKVQRLKYLADGGDFSIKKWVNNGTGWLFITAPPNQRDTLKPLVSAWIDIAIKGLMDRPPQNNNPEMWFILDELPALQKIASLKRGLAEGRKYGACFAAGIQNIFQIEEIYGHAGALALLDMFNTRFYFKVGDERTASYASKTLGEKEVIETNETLSYGSNTIRDGVNINTTQRNSQLVLPTEILNLPTRTAYVKLAGDWPITKLKMRLQNGRGLWDWLCRGRGYWVKKSV